MQYRNDKHGNPLSILGYGCMRFTQQMGKINIEKTEKELLAAIDAGVNYFDTAYIYPGSEAAVGEIFERNHVRDKVNIATKLPHYLMKDLDGVEKTFNEELKRLRTDHIDYYLMHMLTDLPTWQRLEALGIRDWIRKKMDSGAIRQIGFSYHGNADMFCKLIDANEWDFCQIQYNYLDETSQAGRDGLKYAASKGIPVVIMEPLRGGRLVNGLPKSALKLLSSGDTPRTPAQWAFDWLWNQPEVTVVLSGMNSLEMVQDNTASADKAYAGMLSEADQEILQKVVKEILSHMAVGCTGCRYCMPCPKNVDIPGIFFAYNMAKSQGLLTAEKSYFMTSALRRDSTSPSNCVECGKCEKHCPQHIEIRKMLKEAGKTLENPIYKAAAYVTRKVMKL
ncbi:MAG: aldo/keto reductase [Anaerolineaceae bacterium]|nr:aldo/keto reductase [Anaerolineaceae bacterium]